MPWRPGATERVGLRPAERRPARTTAAGTPRCALAPRGATERVGLRPAERRPADIDVEPIDMEPADWE